MSVSIKLLSMENPYHNTRYGYGSKVLNASPSLRFSIVTPRAKVVVKELGVGFQLPQRQMSSFNRSTVVFSVSHDESKFSVESDEIKEAWKLTLAAFREQAIKTQGVSEEAYKIYFKRAKSILKRTSEQLKIEAEKARMDLSVVAKECNEDGIRYYTEDTKISPEVTEVVKPSSLPAHHVKAFSTLLDCLDTLFYLLYSNGWLIVFMVTGSISAILASALFAFSIESLRSHEKGKTSLVALLEGQEAIAMIICVKESIRLFQKVMTGPAPAIFSTYIRFYVAVSGFVLLMVKDDWYLFKKFKGICSKTHV